MPNHEKRTEVWLSLTEGANIDDVIQQLTTILRDAHNLKGNEDNDFTIQTPEQLMETFDTVINMVTIVIWGIVSISLLVGGIGIMNIMLISVTKRTREIAICKAIGAKRHHI